MKKELLFSLLDSNLNIDQNIVVETALIDILIKERVEKVTSKIKEEVYKDVENMSKKDIIDLLKEKLEQHG